MTIASLVKRFQGLKSARGTWESHWQELAKFCLPHKATITTKKTPGTKIATTLYDSTAQQSVMVMAAGLQSYMTNPSSKWFELSLSDKELMKSSEVKAWLKDTEDRIFDCLNSSNFNEQIHETYIDLSVFGTPCLYEEEDPKDDVRFYTRPISEIFIVENERNRVDTVFRFFSYTVRQAYQRWGKNSGQKVLEAYEAKKYENDMDFLHIVLPRSERDVGKKDARNLPFASLYVEISQQKKVSEGGYTEFPFFVPRYAKVSSDVYGYSPAMIALPDIKTLNAMSKTILKAGQKQVDPPIVLPHDGYIMPFNTTAGAVNMRTSGTAEDKIDILNFKGNIPMGMEMENQRRTSIKRAFFVDLFLMLAEAEKMTATEVRERVSEKMLILGPVLGRLMSELLDPVITRTFNILLRNQKLAQMPEILQGQNYKIVYISPLAKAQRISEAQSINSFLMSLAEIGQVNPAIWDNVNFDKTARELGDIYNVSGNILNSDDEVKAIREARQKQQEIAQALEMAEQGARATKDVAQAEKSLKGAK